MNEANNQPEEQKDNFDTIEKWFNDALRDLKLLIFSLECIKEDDRNPVECISLREKLDEFATGYTFLLRAKRYQEIYNASGFSRILEDVKTANGLQISSGIHHLNIDGKIHYTAVEALGTLLNRICSERNFFDETVRDYDIIRDEYITKYPQDNWKEYWYGIINFHVNELSECGVNKESLEQIRLLFDQQKYGYRSWIDRKSDINSDQSVIVPASEQAIEKDSLRKHSPDFRSIMWDGKEYSFTAQESRVVEALWESHPLELSDAYLLEKAESTSRSLRDVFRRNGKTNKAWGTVIINGGSKGSRRLK